MIQQQNTQIYQILAKCSQNTAKQWKYRQQLEYKGHKGTRAQKGSVINTLQHIKLSPGIMRRKVVKLGNKINKL